MTNLMHNYVMVEDVYYYNPQHVSNKTVLISGRSNTASGIVLSVSDRPRPVCRLKGSSSTCTPDGQVEEEFINLHTGKSLTDRTVPDAVLIQSDLLMMGTVLLETCRGL